MKYLYVYLGDIFYQYLFSHKRVLHLTIVFDKNTLEVVYYGFGEDKEDSLNSLEFAPKEIRVNSEPLNPLLIREWFFEVYGLKSQVEGKLKELFEVEEGSKDLYIEGAG